MTQRVRGERASEPGAAAQPGDPVAWGLMAGITGLYFSRWWMVTEGTWQGDTLWIMQGWLVALLFAGWVGWRAGRNAGLNLQPVWAPGLLVLGQLVSSGLVLWTGQGQLRHAWTWFWEWLALGISTLLISRVLLEERARRAWLIASLAGVITLAGYGLWQRYFDYPELAREYDALRQELDELEQGVESLSPSQQATRLARAKALSDRLRKLGLTEQMLVGQGRKSFENRLKHSTEPLGKFALTNTLAAFLLVWLIIGIALGLAIFQSGQITSRWQVLAWGILLGVVAYCLLLTKSRTAYVGFFCGGMGWGLTQVTRLRKSLWPVLLGGAVVCGLAVLAIGIGWATGSLDKLVLAEAPKSLQYRLEYWWSTGQVLKSHWLLGVGSGQFRSYYLREKLPQSSEEIADPHNCVLDAWVTGGLLSTLGLLACFGLLLRRLLQEIRRNKKQSNTCPPGTVIPLSATVQQSRVESSAPTAIAIRGMKLPVKLSPLIPWWDASDRWNPVMVGGLLSFVAVYAKDFGSDPSLLVLAGIWRVLCTVLEALWPEETLISNSIFPIAGLALGVHLLGAGGLSMPAVTQLLFVLVILSTSQSRNASAWRIQPLQTFTSGLILTVLAWKTAVAPVWNSHWPLTMLKGEERLETRDRLCRQAIEADPLNPEGWSSWSFLKFFQWQYDPDRPEQTFEDAVETMREAVRMDPVGYQQYQTLGELYWQRWKVSGEKSAAREAVKWWTEARARYPHHAGRLAQLAEAQQVAGEKVKAAETAREALALDDLNHRLGHSDKYFSENLRKQVSEIAARGSRSVPGATPAAPSP